LCRDNVPCVLLCSWDIESEYLDEEVLSGVIPVLFAEDPKTAEQAIRDNQGVLKKDIEGLQRPFFMPEHIQLEDAAKVIKKPRYGDVEYSWKMKNLDRLFEAPPSSTTTKGNNS